MKAIMVWEWYRNGNNGILMELNGIGMGLNGTGMGNNGE